ncbi:cadherin-like protein 26 [Xiphophorus maculatus]|uniref:cadherin-like protein 26 n=1 Tax=Xiphophorus maculatus TaxID=8083 RepID=UPI000C6C98C9|nr:cadherin-like protein 26 [Xiphophorus maculatus]
MAMKHNDLINIATDIRLTEIHGPGVDKEPLNLFKIDNMTAKIWVMQPVDREKHDHFKKAQKYTLIVKATDHGQPKPLSSFTTVIINIADGNRHLPVFTKQKGEASVKEGLQGVLISRLQVTDEDTRGTKAWRAKYKIQGDTNNNFRIDTDPETNEGLLYVQKALDYEEDPLKNIIISSENEIPYFTCKVINRNTAGLWEIKTVNSSTFSEAQGVTGTKEMRLSTYYLTVNVEDVNEPPVFDPSNKTVTVFEDVALGYYLEILIAKDPDVNGANQIRYMIGEDPAGFVTVDSNSGKIITSKSLDRESQFVKDGLYVIKIYATDNGEPSHTGTATLSIKIIDVNDNAPSLDKSFIDMCQRDKISSPERIPFPDDISGQYLIMSNTEGPGSDCKLPLGKLDHIGHGRQKQVPQGKPLIVMPTIDEQWMISHGSSTSGMKKRHQQQEIKKANQKVRILQSQHVLEDLLLNLMKTKVLTLEESGKELGDYEPVMYADEGDSEHKFELDTLSDPGVSFDQDMELDYKFLPLASICSPDIAAQTTETYFCKEQSLVQQDIFIL